MKIFKVWFDDKHIYVQIETGHIIGTPLSWYERLQKAAPEQRLKYEIGPLEKAFIGKI